MLIIKRTIFWHIFNKTINFAHMIELAQHIEVLLLENDCVIIPEFGGFVAHYTPAIRTEENIFLPPIRAIGFNPQLRLNDGLLVQSYMAVYDTNFSDAAKIIEAEVAELIATLHKEGKVYLANVGELNYTIHEAYEFIPYNDKITTPYLYGLDSFEMKELSVLHRVEEKVLVPVVLKKKKSYEIRTTRARAVLRNVVAVVAAIALFFAFSTPVENTHIEKGNYAQLLPVDLFEKIEEQSVVMTPVAVKQEAKKVSRVTKTPPAAYGTETGRVSAKPLTVKEVKVARPEVNENKKNDSVQSDKSHSQTVLSNKAKAGTRQADANFHIIVAGGITLKDAEIMAGQLKAKGFADAKALSSDGKVRVSITSCATREEAMRQLLKLRENEAYRTAWMLVK